MDRSVHPHQHHPQHHPHHEHQHHTASERWNYYKARRKDHTALIFACIAAGVAAVVGIGYLFMSSGSKPAKRGADTSITAPAPAKGIEQLPADSKSASNPSEGTPPSGPAGADAPAPSKILPAAFKDDIEDKFESKDPQR